MQVKRLSKRHIARAVETFDVSDEPNEVRSVAVRLRSILDAPQSYTLTRAQRLALLSEIARGGKFIVTKTNQDGTIMDVAVRPSMYQRLRAFEILSSSDEFESIDGAVEVRVIEVIAGKRSENTEVRGENGEVSGEN